MLMKIIQYIRDVRAEMKHVSWPTKKQVTMFTVLVIVLSILVAYFLGAFDYVFTRALEMFI